MDETDERASAKWRMEHAGLHREAAQLARVGSGVSAWSASATPDTLRRVRAFLHDQLLGHLRAEETVVYPAMDELLGVEQFTISMRADHDAIRQRADALTAVIDDVGQGPPSTAQAEALREHLYGLWAIVDLHLDKEEQILFDLLDTRFTQADIEALHQQTAVHVAPPEQRPLTHTRQR
jgi:iron-sulfur cluster repair protein YtfE (RIC family)